MALQRLKEAAENAKKELSSAQQADINLPFIAMDASGPKNLMYTLTRAEFERITRDLLERCKTPVTSALHDANLKLSDINEVILADTFADLRCISGGDRRLRRVVLERSKPIEGPTQIGRASCRERV